MGLDLLWWQALAAGLVAPMLLWLFRGGRFATALVAVGLALGTAVVTLAGLQAVEAGREPALFVEAINLGPVDSPVLLGRGDDVRGLGGGVLDDPYADTVHARLVPNGEEVGIQILSRQRRVELDGVDAGWAPVADGMVIELGGRSATITDVGRFFATVELTLDDGRVQRVWGSPRHWGVALMPILGQGRTVPIAALNEDLGLQLRRPREAPPGPKAVFNWREGRVWLGYPTPGDRLGGRLVVDGELLSHRVAPVADGQRLTLGYTRYGVRSGVQDGVPWVVLEPDRAMPHPVPDEPGLLSFGDDGGPLSLPLGRFTDWQPLLSVETAPDGGLLLHSMSPDTGLSGDGEEVAVGPGLPQESAILMPGGLLRVQDSDCRGVDLRWHAAFSPLAAGWQRTGPTGRLWLTVATWLALHLLLSGVLALRGVLHRHNLPILHGCSLLAGVGLVLLAQLGAHTPSTRLADLASRQALFLAAGWAVAGVLLFARYGRHHPLRWLDRPAILGFSRVWILPALAMAFMVVQMPFGEAGIAVPGMSLQPIELVKTLVLIYLAHLTVDVLRRKAARRRHQPELREGPTERLRYTRHMAPVVVVMGLAFAINDVSPVVILGLLTALMYVLSVRRPHWGPRQLWRSWLVEWIAVGGLGWLAVVVGLRLVPAVGRRLATWRSPWTVTASGEQLVRSLWAMADGRWLGTGLGQANASLPPAVQDDFIAALLVERLGYAGLLCLVATWAVVLAAGWRVAGLVRRRREPGVDRLSDDATAARLELIVRGGWFLMLIQLAINLGSATGVLPVVGQPLPFISAGGSHLLGFCLPVLFATLAASRGLGAPAPAPEPTRELQPLVAK